MGKFLFILRKNLSLVPWDKCARWFLDLPNFVKAYQTSKTPSTCLGAGPIFVRREIWQICQFTRHDLKENVNQENVISIFSRSSPKLAKIISYKFARQLNGEVGRFVPRYAAWILTQNTTNTALKLTFQLHLQGQVLFNLYIPMQTDQKHIRMQTTRVSRAHVQVTSLIKLKAAKLRIQEQTSVEKGFLKRCLFPCDWHFWLTHILPRLSAPTLDKLKIWQRQILSRFLEGPNKFCQSSALGH